MKTDYKLQYIHDTLLYMLSSKCLHLNYTFCSSDCKIESLGSSYIMTNCCTRADLQVHSLDKGMVTDNTLIVNCSGINMYLNAKMPWKQRHVFQATFHVHSYKILAHCSQAFEYFFVEWNYDVMMNVWWISPSLLPILHPVKCVSKIPMRFFNVSIGMTSAD